MKKTYFFGWTNIKWFLKELLAIGSGKSSYFSKKRIESGISFTIAQAGMILFLIKNVDKMDVYDICLWAATEFAVAGYMISHIEKSKKSYTINNQGESEEIEQINS
jgi:hypothetical protein